MKLAIDLHIHTALSPCSDIEMTPNNIVNMAKLKGLDIIAITDHNSAQNCRAVIECSQNTGLLVIPGIEVETKEEIHVICLFQDIESAIKMQNLIKEHLPKMKNSPKIFGEQPVFDKDDNVIFEEEQLLITAANIGINEIFKKTEELGGVVIPAHVDRNSYSIISNLGIIPEELKIKYIELSKNCDTGKFLSDNASLKKYNILKSSDAHFLSDILEKESFVEIESKNIENFLNEFKNY